MTAYTPKSELGFKLPEMLSYHSTWDDADYEPVLPRRRRGGFGAALSAAAAAIARYRDRRAAIAELNSMSDRELADIGINRYDIGRVHSKEFAREHSCRGSNAVGP